MKDTDFEVDSDIVEFCDICMAKTKHRTVGIAKQCFECMCVHIEINQNHACYGNDSHITGRRK